MRPFPPQIDQSASPAKPGHPARLVAVAIVFLASWSLAFGADYSTQQVPRAAGAPSGRVTAQHAYIFGEPAYWSGTLRWRYNGAGAPPQLGANKAATIQQLVAASAKWTAACGVQIVYDGETTAAPSTLLNGQPDRVSVIGWQVPDDGFMAATHDWTDTDASGDTVIVDADIALSPTTVTTPQILASIITHEWGHAIGLGHSAAPDTMMSGPPDAAYSSVSELTPDDVQGCRCLYGPPGGASAGFLCSLPTLVDFGAMPVGSRATPRGIDVTNDGSAPMTIRGIQIASTDFAITTNRCAAGTSLAPGTTCTLEISAQPSAVDMRRAEAIVDTSEGPYRIPLRVMGLAADFAANPPPAAPPPAALNVEGTWWNAPAGTESGWGLTLAHQDDVIFAAWYTYDTSGKALWLSMTANRTGTNAYAGTLYRTTGPALDAAPFNPAQVQRIAAGNATLRFSDAGAGTFEYTYGGVTQSKPITRLAFGPMPACTFGGPTTAAAATNYQGNWWTPGGAESGWGVYFTHQGDNVFASWFTYDSDGTPMWLSATATRTGNGVFSGTLVRTTGPAFSAAPFNSASVQRTPVGTLNLTFADGNNATFAYTVAFGNPQTTVTQSKQLTRMVFRAPGTICT
jgi:hypothetical protein